MRYLEQPFAVSGDKVEIPTDAQPTGAVSLVQGYGPDYSKDPETDPTAKRIERLAFNGIMFDVTDALIQWQRGVFPTWAAGVAYQQNAIVKSGANIYVSLKAANADLLTVTASWRRVILGGASATIPGFLRLATNAEAAAGAVADAAVTPAGLAAALAASTAVVPASRRVLAGNGLTGGGALGADVTVTLATPGTLTGSSTNAVTAESHTHALNVGVADVAGAAPLASPILSGNPTAPTQAAGNNTLRIANTAFVTAAVAAALSGLGALASLNSVNNAQWSGTALSVANGGTGATTPAAALTALGAAPLANPALTGNPTAPTQAAGNSSTRIATTAFVDAAFSGLGALASLNSVNNAQWSGTALSVANGGTGATTSAAALQALGGAPLASPALTGNPTAPTQAPGNSSTRIANTAFVEAAVNAGVGLADGLLIKGSIAAGGDANTFRSTGIWQVAGADAASIANLPDSNGGSLEVIVMSPTGALSQRYTTYAASPTVSVRRATAGGAFGAWTALAFAADVVPVARAVSAGNGLTGGGSLAADRAIALGAPSTVTATSTNVVSATSHNHELTMATAAQYRANSSPNPLGPDQVWGAAAFVALAQAATIAVNMGLGFNFTTTMTGNRVLGNPTNATPGQSGIIVFTSDAGNRTLTFGTSWKFAGPVPAMAVGSGVVNVLAYTVVTPTFIVANLLRSVS